MNLSKPELETVLRCVDKVFDFSAERDRLRDILAWLEAENKALRDRFSDADTERNGAKLALKTAFSRIMQLEAEAKQAREDEAWALSNEIEVKALEHGRWKLTWWTENAIEQSFDESIHAAIRDLRSKVEGGAR